MSGTEYTFVVADLPLSIYSVGMICKQRYCDEEAEPLCLMCRAHLDRAKAKRFEQMYGKGIDWDQRRREASCEWPTCVGGTTLHIDHNHETNVVRGFLCQRHNTRVLPVIENPTEIAQGLLYLKERDGLDPAKWLHDIALALAKLVPWTTCRFGCGSDLQSRSCV